LGAGADKEAKNNVSVREIGSHEGHDTRSHRNCGAVVGSGGKQAGEEQRKCEGDRITCMHL